MFREDLLRQIQEVPGLMFVAQLAGNLGQAKICATLQKWRGLRGQLQCALIRLQARAWALHIEVDQGLANIRGKLKIGVPGQLASYIRQALVYLYMKRPRPRL